MMNSFDMGFWLKMEPMKYADRQPEGLSAALQKKREAMIENEGGAFMATEKHDGYWAMFIRGKGDELVIRSRNKGINSGEYGIFTGKVPHLVQEMKSWPEGTVLLGEICWEERGRNSSDITTILGCLDEKAVARQKDDPLHCYLFDCLSYAGENVMKLGYEKRFLTYLLGNFNGSGFFKITGYQTEGEFLSMMEGILREGGEGCVIYRKDYPYEPGKRSLAWKTLKLKMSMPEMELLVEEALDPNREYDGKEVGGWQYWEIETTGELESCGDIYHLPYTYLKLFPTEREKETGIPVTKPYFNGWKIGVKVTHDGSNYSNVTSGLTDEDREWLASLEAKDLITNHQLYARVQAMQEGQKGALRHPVFLGFKIMDKPEEIEFEDI